MIRTKQKLAAKTIWMKFAEIFASYQRTIATKFADKMFISLTLIVTNGL